MSQAVEERIDIALLDQNVSKQNIDQAIQDLKNDLNKEKLALEEIRNKIKNPNLSKFKISLYIYIFIYIFSYKLLLK